MHPETYEIKEFESNEKAKEEGFILLGVDECDELSGMNRKQRRAWLAQKRREGKK